jgi:hypothetical protein
LSSAWDSTAWARGSPFRRQWCGSLRTPERTLPKNAGCWLLFRRNFRVQLSSKATGTMYVSLHVRLPSGRRRKRNQPSGRSVPDGREHSRRCSLRRTTDRRIDEQTLHSSRTLSEIFRSIFTRFLYLRTFVFSRRYCRAITRKIHFENKKVFHKDSIAQIL